MERFYSWIEFKSMTIIEGRKKLSMDKSIIHTKNEGWLFNLWWHPWIKSADKDNRWHTWTQPMWFVSWLVNKFDITQVPFAQLPLIIDQWKTTFALPDGFPWEGYGLINSLIFRRESWFSYRRSMNPHKVCNMKKLITILCFIFDLHHYNS